MISIIFGMLITIIHYLSEKIHFKSSRIKQELLSFTAGITITYIFVDLLPSIVRWKSVMSEIIFLFMLAGYSVFHVIEKYIYQHESKSKLHHDIKEMHSIGFFIYHLFLGITFVQLMESNILKGILFIFPLTLHTATSSASLNHIHEKIKENFWMRILLSTSTLIGILLAKKILLIPLIYDVLMSFSAGTILYIVTRDAMPKGKKGNIEAYLWGLTIYLLVIILTRII